MIRLPAGPPQPGGVEGSRETGSPRARPDPRRDLSGGGDPSGRRGSYGRRDGALGDGMVGEGGYGDGSDRPAAFDRRMREALAGRTGDSGRDRETVGDPEEGRVLAVAPALPPAPWPMPEPGRTSPGAPHRTPTGEAVVARLTEWIEHAVRSDLSASAGRSVSLRIALDGPPDEAQHVTVSITPDGLDVSLGRGAGTPQHELIEAAQHLAERLRARFGNRRVRVLGGVETAGDRPAGDTLSELGRLLGVPRGQFR